MQSNIVGHVDHGEFHAKIERHLRFTQNPDSTLMFHELVASCSCLTKTPEVQYHHHQCKYRLAKELMYDTETQDKQPSS